MPFQITITDEAESQLRWLTVREQRLLEGAFDARLHHQPMLITKAIKHLRPNLLAEFELRVRDLRALYNVKGHEIVIVAVGRKVGNQLIVKGEVFHGHQDHPPESA